jgi:hypothetical protein
MALNCESCGAENSTANQYCGQCGKKLERRAAAPAGEFELEPQGAGQAAHIDVSADLPLEAIYFDNRIPLIAAEGTGHRNHPPPEVAAQMHGRLEGEVELLDYLRHDGQTRFDVGAQQDTEQKGRMEALRWKEAELESRGIFLPWSTTNAADDPPVRASAEPGETASVGYSANLDAVMDAVTEPDETAGVGDSAVADAIMDAASGAGELPPDRPNLAVESRESARTVAVESPERACTGISGPSFPGLPDDGLPQHGVEAHEPKSHFRRNIAFAVLAAAVILAALQWRSSRDHGLGSVLGSRQSYGQSDARNGSPGTKPSHEQVPSTPPAVARHSHSQNSGPPSATGAPRAIDNSPGAGHKLPARQATNPRPSAPAARAAPVPAPATASAYGPGAGEMNHAARASDAEARAAWLWRAVGKGNPRAQVELATMYQQGNGVVRNCDQAQILLRSAAAKGNAQAKLNLQEIELHGGCSPR